MVNSRTFVCRFLCTIVVFLPSFHIVIFVQGRVFFNVLSFYLVNCLLEFLGMVGILDLAVVKVINHDVALLFPSSIASSDDEEDSVLDVS